MTSADWADPNARCLTIHLDGTSDPDRAEDGTPEVDDDFLVLVNGWWEPLTFTIPDLDGSRVWQRELDSYDPAAADGAQPLASRRRSSRSAPGRSSSCAAPAEPGRADRGPRGRRQVMARPSAATAGDGDGAAAEVGAGPGAAARGPTMRWRNM